MTRARPRCVLDASAVAAVLFREPGGERVLRVLPATGWAAPPLLPIEIANVARHKVRSRRMGRTDAEKLLATLDRWGIRRVDVGWRDAWDLASRHDLTLYDAAYLHLAASRDVPLITLDAELRVAAGSRALP